MTEADKVVSHIIKQISNKIIQISLHRLLEIVKPEIQQDIINAIVNLEEIVHHARLREKRDF